jgi:hypothetical protein
MFIQQDAGHHDALLTGLSDYCASRAFWFSSEASLSVACWAPSLSQVATTAPPKEDRYGSCRTLRLPVSFSLRGRGTDTACPPPRPPPLRTSRAEALFFWWWWYFHNLDFLQKCHIISLPSVNFAIGWFELQLWKWSPHGSHIILLLVYSTETERSKWTRKGCCRLSWLLLVASSVSRVIFLQAEPERRLQLPLLCTSCCRRET